MHDASRGERDDEAVGRAVEAGRFRAIEFDEAVIDAQSGEGREEMLDQGDAMVGDAEGGAPVGAGDALDAGRDWIGERLIEAAKDAAGVDRRGAETNVDAGSGDEAHALEVRGGRQGSLGSVADDAHGVRLSDILSEVPSFPGAGRRHPWTDCHAPRGREGIIVSRPRAGLLSRRHS